jgi:hypothetical protein
MSALLVLMTVLLAHSSQNAAFHVDCETWACTKGDGHSVKDVVFQDRRVDDVNKMVGLL